jgi:hypothetical protein
MPFGLGGGCIVLAEPASLMLAAQTFSPTRPLLHIHKDGLAIAFGALTLNNDLSTMRLRRELLPDLHADFLPNKDLELVLLRLVVYAVSTDLV